MNWVDLVVLAVLAVSGMLAFLRGLVREVLGLGAWVVAAVVASSYGLFSYTEPYVRQQFSDPTTAAIVAFGGVFLIVLIVCWIIASNVAGAIQRSALGGLDRTLGLVFGLARGVVLLSVVYILVGMAIPIEQWPAPFTNARALPVVHRGAAWLADHVPPAYRPSVAAPPGGRATTAASLMQSSPIGRAQGSRPVRD